MSPMTPIDIAPPQDADYRAIVGDQTIDVIGVKGIGPKTAAKLLREYGDIATIFKSIRLIPESIRTKLRDSRNLILRNQKKILSRNGVPVANMTSDANK